MYRERSDREGGARQTDRQAGSQTLIEQQPHMTWMNADTEGERRIRIHPSIHHRTHRYVNHARTQLIGIQKRYNGIHTCSVMQCDECVLK
mmetsp:Transcript_22727/g.65007  ORF Transcript_22727/g.65007 Transcript_22727/m.65007 type:complete len:90 (+) Transcript_22727:115-384(+)